MSIIRHTYINCDEEYISCFTFFQAQNEVIGAAVAEIASQQQLYPQTGNQSHYSG